jgi:two-component system, NarL family, response regulator YdfI
VIRLLIAAESAVVRAGLEALVASSPGVQVLGSFSDYSQVETLLPDVVLASVPSEDLPATSAAAVLLTGESWTAEAVRAGVRAILPANASAAEILAAVESAAAGLAVVDPRDLDALLAVAPPVPVSTDSPNLTARELEVLRMLAEGAANKTIAWKLAISEHTVKFHVASILAKLGASTRTEAVTVGIRKGLVLL